LNFNYKMPNFSLQKIPEKPEIIVESPKGSETPKSRKTNDTPKHSTKRFSSYANAIGKVKDIKKSKNLDSPKASDENNKGDVNLADLMKTQQSMYKVFSESRRNM